MGKHTVYNQNNTAESAEKHDQAQLTGHTSYPGYMRLFIAGMVLMLAAYLLSIENVHIPNPERTYIPLHLILELLSIVASFSVFAIGWFGYKQTGNKRDLFIAVIFFITSSLDLVHTFSYKGMPDFLGTNSVGKAAAYWLSARLITAVGLLVMSFIRPDNKSRWLSPRVLITVAFLIIATAVSAFTVFEKQVSEAAYNTTTGSLTSVKIMLEYFSVLLYAAAFFIISEKRGWEAKIVRLLKKALILSIFMGVAFTLYTSPYDWMNALGHIYKILAFYIILNALFVSSLQRPYEQLSKAKDQLQILYADAQDHRREIERLFAHIGNALSSSLFLEEAVDQVAGLAADMLHADCSVVALLNNDGSILNAAAQRGMCGDNNMPSELAVEFGNDAVASGKTVFVNDLSSVGLVWRESDNRDFFNSLVCTPMFFGSSILGVVAIYSYKQNAFDNGDVMLLEAFASHAAVAIHNAMRYERESKIADVLQKSLLTPARIINKRFEIAQVYEPAMDDALVGGDFYDVVENEDGKIAIIIGDVSGKGLQAAVHTAMVKYSLRAFLAEKHSPAEMMRLLNNVAYSFLHSESFITLFLGILDSETGELVYASAGHEPPIYTCNGEYIELEATGTVLGLLPDSAYAEAKTVLEKGSTLLLYTDGISEARQGDDFMGTEGIADKLLTCESLDSDDIAKCIHQEAIGFAGGKLRDDAAILAVKSV